MPAPIWYLGHEHVGVITQAASHADEAKPQVRSLIKAAEAVAAAEAFYTASEKSWFGASFSADFEARGQPGQVAVDSLRTLSAKSTILLGELLQQRIDRTASARNAMLAMIAVSLLIAGYLFYAFYLVMSGGLQEVSRHLEAMTDGDLTTSPQSLGRDEAAELMLAKMQESLRRMVHQVRHASDGIVNASNSVQELDRATQQNAAMVEQTAAAAASLRDQAHGLAGEVARFKMPA